MKFSAARLLIVFIVCCLLDVKSSFAENVLSNAVEFLDIKTTPAGDISASGKKLACKLQKGAAGIEMFYTLEGQSLKGPVIMPGKSSGKPPYKIVRSEVVRRDQAIAVIRADFAGADGSNISMDISLRNDESYVEILPGPDIQTLVVKNECSCLVIPDLFADDLVLEADQTAGAELPLPDCNWIMQLTGDQNLIVMYNWADMAPKARVTVANCGKRLFDAVEIKCTGSDKVWISMLGAKGIWHQNPAADFSVYEDKPLSWQVPFNAAWRVNFRKSGGIWEDLSECWWMAYKATNGIYSTHTAWSRGCGVIEHATRGSWLPGLGNFIYPCYIETNAAGFIRLPKSSHASSPVFRQSPFGKYFDYAGRVFVYPLDDWQNTTNGAPAPLTIMRRIYSAPNLTEHFNGLLPVWSPNDIYPATCGITHAVEGIFDDKREQKARQDISAKFGKMNMFVSVMFDRVEDYIKWESELRDWYASELRKNDELAPAIYELEDILDVLRLEYNEFKATIKSPEYVKSLSDKVIALIDSNQKNKAEMVKEYGREIRTNGGGADARIGHFRVIVKALRQKAARLYISESDPDIQAFLLDYHRRTLNMLRIKFGMDGK